MISGDPTTNHNLYDQNIIRESMMKSIKAILNTNLNKKDFMSKIQV